MSSACTEPRTDALCPTHGFSQHVPQARGLQAAWRSLRQTRGDWQGTRWWGCHPCSNHSRSALLALGLYTQGFLRKQKARKKLNQRHLTQGADFQGMDRLRCEAQRPIWCRTFIGKRLHPGVQGSADGNLDPPGPILEAPDTEVMQPRAEMLPKAARREHFHVSPHALQASLLLCLVQPHSARSQGLG